MFIKFNKVNKRFYDKVIFKDLELIISADRKIGLLGDNGSGKSTMLKLIAGIDIPNFGTIEVSPKDTAFAFIMSDQDLLSSYDYPYEFLLTDELSALYEAMFVTNLADDDTYQRFDELNGYLFLNDLDIELKKFNVPIEDISQKFETLSSGERLKMQFAKISSHQYDGLLLDEPTATLDKEGKEFLYDFLNKWHKFCIIASHDRKLINTFAKQVLVLQNSQVKTYSGNYDFYVQSEVQEENRIKEDNVHTERKIEALNEETERLIEDVDNKVRKPRDNDKMTYDYKTRRKNIKGMRKVQVLNNKKQKLKFKMFDEEVDEVERTSELLNLDFKPLKSKILIEGIDIEIQIEDKLILTGGNFTIRSKDRIIIEGKNGTGKSSLIKAIYNNANLTKGEIKKNEKIDFGYYEQTLHSGISFLKSEDYILGGREWIKGENRINALADFFEFPKTLLYKSLDYLSEGERAKLKFMKIFSYEPNFLLIDEPTNFLDLRTLTKIQEILDETSLPLIIVSHDDEFNASLKLTQKWKIIDKSLITEVIKG